MTNGSLLVISAPSGAGKSSLVKAMRERDARLGVCTSHTTRPPRPGETNGVEYHFCERADFEKILESDGFIEHAEVFGNHYGTSRAELERLREAGTDVILEIDQQGAAQVRQQFADAITIFILPPSREALRERLTGRGQDAGEVIEGRLAEAAGEIAHCGKFDYLVINDRFAEALEDLLAIVRCARLARSRRLDELRPMIGELTAST